MASTDLYVNPDDKIWSFVSSIAVDEGVELYDMIRPRPNALRVFLDKPKAEEGMRGSGVTSGECSNVCKRLRHSFVVEGVNLGISAEPELEVSSPGLERELRLPNHFSAAVGSQVKLVANDQSVTGLLESFDKEVLFILENSNKELKKILYGEIKKAQIVYV